MFKLLYFCTSYLVINFITSVILNMLKRSSSVAQISGGEAMPQRPLSLKVLIHSNGGIIKK